MSLFASVYSERNGILPRKTRINACWPCLPVAGEDDQECEVNVVNLSDVSPPADIRLIDCAVNGCREVSRLATVDLGLSLATLIAFAAHVCAWSL